MDPRKRVRNLAVLSLLLMLAAGGLFIAAARDGTRAATARGTLGILALLGGLAASLPIPRPGDLDPWPDPSPPPPAREPPAVPQQSIYLTLHADSPPAIRRWLESVEHMARARPGERVSPHAQAIRRFASKH